MASNLIFPESVRLLAAERVALALLRTLGGATIRVRVSAPAAAPGDASQLGLAASASEDVVIEPVMVRPPRRAKPTSNNLGRKRRELLISAVTLKQVRTLNDAVAVTEFFDGAIGVFVGDRLMRVESTMAEEFAGFPYLYRVVVSE